jgi:hypothetical protein
MDPHFFFPILECLLSAALSTNKVEKKQATPPIIIFVQYPNGNNDDIKNRNNGTNNIKLKPIVNAVFSGIALILSIIFSPSLIFFLLINSKPETSTVF